MGGDRVRGGAVVWGRRLRGERGIPLVLGQVLEAMVCACLELLVAGSGQSLGEGERERWRFYFEHYWKMCVLLSSCLKETRG